MEDVSPSASRRSLIKCAALGALGLSVIPTAEGPSSTPTTGAYQVIDQRRLSGGGLGLFIAVMPNPSREQLGELGDQLRERFQGETNVVVEVFDDADAAKTVRTGSRIVGQEPFQLALAHQKASYHKSSKPPRNEFIIYGESRATVRY